MKKTLSLLLAMLMLFSSFGFVLASAGGDTPTATSKVTVIFDANGGTFPANATTKKEFEMGDFIDAEGISIPSKTFMSFDKWTREGGTDLGTADKPSIVIKAEYKAGTCGENASYTVASGMLTIVGTGVITGNPDWAKNASEITTIYFAPISGGYFTLGEKCFAGLTALTEVNLSKVDITEESKGALMDCTALKKVTMPFDYSVIPAEFFKNDKALEAFNFTAGNIQKIGADAFMGCTALPTTLDFTGKKGIANVEPRALGFDSEGKAIADYVIMCEEETDSDPSVYTLYEYAKGTGFYMTKSEYNFKSALPAVKAFVDLVTGKIIPMFVQLFNQLVSFVTGLISK